jgi:predicted alpha/beta-hydrolase family hydrolase
VRSDVILLPGFGGAAEQPVLVKLSKRLEPLGFRCHRHAPKRGKLTPELTLETTWLRGLMAEFDGPRVLVGRSFGGRVCVREAKADVAACVLLGFPVRPPDKRRPLDEAALVAVQCPTLVVQGDVDELGPLPLVKRLAKKNRLITVHVVKGAGHSFGAHEGAALDQVAAWLEASVTA